MLLFVLVFLRLAENMACEIKLGKKDTSRLADALETTLSIKSRPAHLSIVIQIPLTKYRKTWVLNKPLHWRLAYSAFTQIKLIGEQLPRKNKPIWFYNKSRIDDRLYDLIRLRIFSQSPTHRFRTPRFSKVVDNFS